MARKRWTDSGAFTPTWAQASQLKPDRRLLRWLHHFIGPTFVDIGAGVGHYVAGLNAQGHAGYGIDGIVGVETISHGRVLEGNLITPLWGYPTCHTGICIEVGEHVPVESEEMLWLNLRLLVQEQLILSWAPPTQPGRGHVNCRTPEYVAHALAAHGFVVDTRNTKRLRRRVSSGYRTKLWIANKVRYDPAFHTMAAT